ncbi:MAG TPA: hypothetical protein VHO46_15370 [Bacteroidales bacterium]|nr:hypothetical protein [Bacteroidales bacterium]
MKKALILISVVALFIVIVNSCYYDNEEELYPKPESQCDTLNVTFSVKISPILSGNCLSCHSNANSQFGGGISLESISDVRTRSATILAAINHTGPVPMPPNGKLSRCNINQFGIWIRNGMPE